MNFRLKTTSYVADRLKQLQSSTGLTPNILARIAVSLSLKQKSTPSTPSSESGGLDFNRNTLTGEHDYLYRALIAQHAQREVTDNEFFPDLFNAHLERGVRLLSSEYQHAGNYDKFILNLLRQ
jgi:DNA sulfur modification protein DndE